MKLGYIGAKTKGWYGDNKDATCQPSVCFMQSLYFKECHCALYDEYIYVTDWRWNCKKSFVCVLIEF